MKKEEYKRIRQELLTLADSIADSKQPIYTLENDDILTNFKTSGSAAGISLEQALVVFMKKHWDSVVNALVNNSKDPEPIDSRIADLINYLVLSLCAIRERAGQKNAAYGVLWLRPESIGARPETSFSHLMKPYSSDSPFSPVYPPVSKESVPLWREGLHDFAFQGYPKGCPKP